MHTKKLMFALGFALATGCTSSEPTPLPSATFTPHLESQSNVACAEDLAYYGNPAPDLHYGFHYDGDGRMTHADGTWTADGSTADTIDYGYSGDNFSHMLETFEGGSAEITASYDGDNNLTDYTWAYTNGTEQESWTYAFSGYIGPYQPTHEDVGDTGGVPFGYELVYDANNRLVEAIPESGPSTTWTYDDQARTITWSYDGGAWSGVTTYDDGDHELSNTSTGTDPAAIDSEEGYTWDGDRLLTAIYRSGSEEAPHDVQLITTGTLDYSCGQAKSAPRRLIGSRSR